MRRAIVDPKRCKNCKVFQVAIKCDQDAIIRETAEDYSWIDFYHCRGCMKCKQYCVHGAVMEEVQPCDMQHRTTW